MLTAITGINWGDEGKGRMVDLLCRDYDIVARYQGGDNAGHTVKNECGKFVLNLVPSGILHPSIVCVMGGGMVIDPEHLEKEIAALREQGVKITPDNLKILTVLPSPCRSMWSRMAWRRPALPKRAHSLVPPSAALLTPMVIST